MASSHSSAASIKHMFFEGVKGSVLLDIADSKLPGAGLGLYVQRQVPAGTEILRATLPIVSAVESSMDACDNCFRWAGLDDAFEATPKLSSCASCKSVKYCSKGCQRTAWRRYHKEECKIYGRIRTSELKPGNFTQTARMLLRLLILRQQGQIAENQWCAISALKSHKTEVQTSEGVDWVDIKETIGIMREMTGTDLLEDHLHDLYWRINVNRHSVGSALQPPLGSCLVPCAALINHSCNPNSHHFSEGPELVFRSCRAIAENEEITISYIDYTQSLQERQKKLIDEYLFVCKCMRCVKGLEGKGELLTGNSLLDTQIDVAKSQLQALAKMIGHNQHPLHSAESTVLEICSIGYPGKPWPSDVQPMPTIDMILACMFQEEQSWRKALYYWLKICYVIDPLRFPNRLDPQRVENWMSLASLEGKISQISEQDHVTKAEFQEIEATMSITQLYHNIRLTEEATACFGPNHVISKTAAHFVAAMERQLMPILGPMRNFWESKAQQEKFKEKELVLLKWAGVALEPVQ